MLYIKWLDEKRASSRDNNSPWVSLSKSPILLRLWRCRPCRTGHGGDPTPNRLLVMLLTLLLARVRIHALRPWWLCGSVASRSWRSGAGRMAFPFGLRRAGCRFCGRRRIGLTATSSAYYLSKKKKYVSALGRAEGMKGRYSSAFTMVYDE